MVDPTASCSVTPRHAAMCATDSVVYALVRSANVSVRNWSARNRTAGARGRHTSSREAQPDCLFMGHQCTTRTVHTRRILLPWPPHSFPC
jgi:hypothetical protein